jgi:hypothetical protein
MEIGSHYYAVLALCRLLGLKKDIAYKIAYSSQFTDDALIKRVIFRHTPRGVKCHMFGRRRGLDHVATCPKLTTTWGYHHRTMVNTLVPFHFVPGAKGTGFHQRIRTTPNSPLLRELVDEAVRSGDPYHLGIALHALGDAYAHRGFSGIISRGNRVRKFKIDMSTIKGFRDRFLARYIMNVTWIYSMTLAKIMPMYSHSRVGTVPDLSSAEWSYEFDSSSTSFFSKYRSSGPISNPERYRKAFGEFLELIEHFVDANPDVRESAAQNIEASGFYRQLTLPISREETERSWQAYFLEHDLLSPDDDGWSYDKYAWLQKAFKDFKKKKYSQMIVLQADPVDDFSHSDWYRFYLAQREYKEHFDRLIIHYKVY